MGRGYDTSVHTYGWLYGLKCPYVCTLGREKCSKEKTCYYMYMYTATYIRVCEGTFSTVCSHTRICARENLMIIPV